MPVAAAAAFSTKAAAVAATVAATLDDGAGSVLCVSPPGFLGRVAVGVTLNGQQYTAASAGAQLTYYDVDSVGGLSAIAPDALPRPSGLARELNAALFPDFSDDERRLPPRPEYPHADPHADSFPDYSAMFPDLEWYGDYTGASELGVPTLGGARATEYPPEPAEDLPWELEDWRYRRGDPFPDRDSYHLHPLVDGHGRRLGYEQAREVVDSWDEDMLSPPGDDTL